MFNCLSKFMIVKALAVIVLISLGSCFSQENQKAQQKNPERTEGLISEQGILIKKILAAFNPNQLTVEDAKSIQDQFRKAGIHAGPENGPAIKAPGFDPEKLRSLAPPPEVGNDENHKGETLQSRLKIVDEKICKALSLNSSQHESIMNAFRDFYSERDKLMQSQQGKAGPLEKSKIDPLENLRNQKVKHVITEDLYNKFLDLERKIRPEKPIENKTKQD